MPTHQQRETGIKKFSIHNIKFALTVDYNKLKLRETGQYGNIPWPKSKAAIISPKYKWPAGTDHIQPN